MRSARSMIAVLGAMVLLLSACGGDGDGDDASQATESSDDETTETTATPTTDAPTTSEAVTSSEAPTTSEATTTSEAEPTTVVTSETGFPATPVAAFLAQTYQFGSAQGLPTEDQLPFPASAVTAHWYQSDGFYVVVYGALDPALVLCPGNSIQTGGGFEHVSNAPMNGADCSFAPVVAEAPNGVVTCNRMVSYVTLIPAGTEGVLFGTIETMTDGLGVGLTSQVAADPANMPVIDRALIDC